MKSKAVIALGSNISPRRNHLEEAILHLKRMSENEVTHRSYVYETDPVGGPPQPRFLNAALVVETDHSPIELLNSLMNIEKELGRVREGIQNHPRTIDLDIIFYGQLILSADSLEIPHPRFRERGFVLFPLNDIIPSFVDPITGNTVSDLLDEWVSTGGASCERRYKL